MIQTPRDASADPTAGGGAAVARRPRGVLFPDEYAWFVLVASLDVMLTFVILMLGGVEVNPVADAVLRATGFGGMVAFKFALVLVVVMSCEVIGRVSARPARRLARLAVAVSAVPVAIALAQVAPLFISAAQLVAMR